MIKVSDVSKLVPTADKRQNLGNFKLIMLAFLEAFIRKILSSIITKDFSLYLISEGGFLPTCNQTNCITLTADNQNQHSKQGSSSMYVIFISSPDQGDSLLTLSTRLYHVIKVRLHEEHCS